MNKKYWIVGRDNESGEVIELALFAESVESAVTKAVQRGVAVESVVLDESNIDTLISNTINTRQKTEQVPPLPTATKLTAPLQEEAYPSPELKTISPANIKPNGHRWYLIFVAFGFFCVAPFLPILPISAGVFLILLSIVAIAADVTGAVFLAHGSTSRSIIYKLLRINPQKPWRKALRIVTCGVAGLNFVLLGYVGFEVEAEKKLQAEKLATEKAEKQVAKEIANTKLNSITSEAIDAARKGDIETIKNKIEEAHALPNGTELNAINKLEEQLLCATNPEHLKQILVKLPEPVFASFRDDNKIPKHIASGYEPLDNMILDIAKSLFNELEAMRKEEKLRNAEKATRLEEERLAAVEAEKVAAKEKLKAEQKILGLIWNYSESTDTMTQGTIKNAVVRSQNEFQFGFPYGGSQRAILQLRNHPKHGKDVILQVEQGQFLCQYDGCKVEVRFDDGKPQSFNANEAADHSTTVIFISEYDRFISNVKKAERVYIQAQFYQEGSRVFEFDVSDLEWP